MDYKKILRTARALLFKRDFRPRLEVPSVLLPFPKPSRDAIKLNIGGGKGHPKKKGWKIVDLREKDVDISMDITKEKLPFPSNSVDVILISHTLEHIYPQKLKFLLSEFFRVLKPKTGVLRIAVPDIQKAIVAYVKRDYAFFAQSEIGQFDSDAPIGGLLASWFYSTRIFKDPDLEHGDGHVHCFDGEYMAWWLKNAGFRYCWKSYFKKSIIKEMREDGFDLHEYDSLFIEAVK
ncbi:MAG: methyltransferase domain-containing protein [archaeon]